MCVGLLENLRNKEILEDTVRRHMMALEMKEEWAIDGHYQWGRENLEYVRKGHWQIKVERSLQDLLPSQMEMSGKGV